MANINDLRLLDVKQAENNLHALLKGKGSTFPNIIHFLALYRSACERLIFQDFEYSITKDIETKLWDSHGKVNSLFRKALRKFREAAGRKKLVEQRKTAKHFLEFIKSGQRFYRSFIQRLAASFGGVPELEAVANRLTLSTLSIDELVQVSGNLGHLVLLSCHRSLVQLGDLSRWRETELVIKDRNWGPAIGYYDLAHIIYPNSGASHNQLAVISLADSSHLRAIYHLYRALAVEEPHPSAEGNLEIEFKKVQEIQTRNNDINGDQVQEAGEALVNCFMHLHAGCYKGVDIQGYEDNESELMRHLAVDLKEPSLESVFPKLTLINIAAEYSAGVRLKGDPSSTGIVQSFFSLLRINVMTFFTLLQVLLLELERQMSDDSQSTGSKSGSGSVKLTAVTRRVLPALRHYSSWLASNAAILAAGVGGFTLKVHVQELWKIYANTLTLLVSTFPVSSLPSPVEYLLEEDEDTLGFKPLDNDNTQRRYYIQATGSRKPKSHDRGIRRQHPNVEMFTRIRDLLTDGMVVHSQEDVPIQLVGTTFIYMEDGSSPKASFQRSHLPPCTDQGEVTHVDETTFPQLSNSVNNGDSQADLASVSKDPSSRQMVDDLVDSEMADDKLETPLQPELVASSPKEIGNDTSYGLFGTSTAIELEAHANLTNQHPVIPGPLLPNIYNSPFAPQAGERAKSLQARTTISEHSQQSSQSAPLLQQLVRENIESSQSSMPEPTNPNAQILADYRNRPYIEPNFPAKTNFTTGRASSIAYRKSSHSALDAHYFVSPTIDFEFTSSVTGGTDIQTPPNGQGAR